MEKFNSVDDILDFAMKNEQEAVDFYSRLAKNSKGEEMKLVFEEFAQEEVKHKARLQKIKDEGTFAFKKEEVMDLNISDYVVPTIPHPDMSYPEALTLAMAKEKAAFKLYMRLSTKVADAGLQAIFMDLAQEESKHKLRFELEYDEFVLREN
jgi:rubrerythrin